MGADQVVYGAMPSGGTACPECAYNAHRGGNPVISAAGLRSAMANIETDSNPRGSKPTGPRQNGR